MGDCLMPEIGNLAWAPLAALEEVEFFDRHNGVPSLGVIRAGGKAHLFWRALGYTGDTSLWLYIPLGPDDETALASDEGPSLLDGIVFRSPSSRFASVGVADANRLVFEREWSVPVELGQSDIIRPLAEFMIEALKIALAEDLPHSRRQIVEKAQAAVRELVAC